MRIISVVGARPNFMKIAPFIWAIEEHNKLSNSPHIEHILIHTGQHYDNRMSDNFFRELGIPYADINLGIGSGTHAEQVGYTMIALEKQFEKLKPDWVVVVGDVNATLAASVVAKKLHIKLCHIEAGLRSGDMTMPEEINRLVTDRLADLLLTPDTIASENLRKEGVDEHKIKFVGNIMIDTLEKFRPQASGFAIEDILKENAITSPVQKQKTRNFSTNKPFALVTLHRPSNVDHPEVLGPITAFISQTVASERTVLWPVHPRTLKNLEKFRLINYLHENANILLLNPLGYLSMLKLNMEAGLMITDSGGLQEECTVLGTPCLTLRANTERPVTLTENNGLSVLAGNNSNMIIKRYQELNNIKANTHRPELWDGKTAARSLQILLNYYKE